MPKPENPVPSHPRRWPKIPQAQLSPTVRSPTATTGSRSDPRKNYPSAPDNHRRSRLDAGKVIRSMREVPASPTCFEDAHCESPCPYHRLVLAKPKPLYIPAFRDNHRSSSKGRGGISIRAYGRYLECSLCIGNVFTERPSRTSLPFATPRYHPRGEIKTLCRISGLIAAMRGNREAHLYPTRIPLSEACLTTVRFLYTSPQKYLGARRDNE